MQVLRLEGSRSLPFLSALYRPLIWKGTDVCAPLAGWSAAAQVRGLGTERLGMCSVQQLTVFICSHSHGSLQQQTVWNSHFAAHPCNFQSNSPVTRLPAFHKGNHSIGNSRALRVCFLFAIQHRLAKAAWCIPMVTLTATARTPQHPKGLEKGATTRGGYCTHQPPALLLEKSSP